MIKVIQRQVSGRAARTALRKPRSVAKTLKGSQACVDQTQPAASAYAEADRATYQKTSKNTRQDVIPSLDLCNPHINQALGKASGVEKASNSQTDLTHRRGKLHPAQAGDRAGNRSFNRVLVLKHNHQPAMPCHPARARQLLKAGRAAIIRRFPFVIILKQDSSINTQHIREKNDPGSRTTGIVLTAVCKQGEKVIWAMELHHRGQEIRDALLSKKQLRRSRRSRKTRYRAARFKNRHRVKGWLAPSLQHRVNSTVTWINRLKRWAPITSISLENVRFDTQLLQNPIICGIEYQNGTLAGWEVREYLLTKYDHKCAYCGNPAKFLQVEHMTPRCRGGSDSISNLALACKSCNEKKGTMTVEEFGFPELRNIARKPLKDAAAVNSVRWALWHALNLFELPLENGTGGMTKKNRHGQGYPKQHWIDAACVGISGSSITLQPELEALQVTAQARNCRRMCLPDRFGFPKAKAKGPSRFKGLSTGDLVRATVPEGKHKGIHSGRIAIRLNGYFRVGKVDGISFRYCCMIQRADGYSYSLNSLNNLNNLNNLNHSASSTTTRTAVSGAPIL
jgi:5-methylcytosine-specific restriction endonuclease McrA